MAVTNVFTDTISISYTGNGKVVSSQVGTYTGTKDAGVAAVITAGATAQEIDVAFPFATIVAIILATDQDVTVKTNSSGSPVDTLIVKKTAGVVWANDYATTNPITADVTKLFVANAGAVDAKFNVRVLYT